MNCIKLLFGVISLSATLSTSACSKGPKMKNTIFHYSDAEMEYKSYVPGFLPDDFHVMVSNSKAIEALQLVGNNLIEMQIPIDGWSVFSSYTYSVNKNSIYAFQSGGLARIDLTSKKCEQRRSINIDGLELHVSKFTYVDLSSGDLFAAMRSLPSPDEASHSVQIHKFHFDLTSESVFNLPIDVNLIALSDGFVVCPPGNEATDKRTPYRVFNPNGTLHPGPLQKSLTAIYFSGIRMIQPYYAWNEKSLWATSLDRPWAIVSHPAFPNGPSSRTSVLTIADAPKTSGIVFETRHPLGETITALLMSPTHDIFFAAVKDSTQKSDSVMLWMGLVELQGDQYRAQCYRIRSFDGVKNLTLSRDGSNILFTTYNKEKWVAAAARLTDILADVNRRYPDAKLDLDALKAEVK